MKKRTGTGQAAKFSWFLHETAGASPHFSLGLSLLERHVHQAVFLHLLVKGDAADAQRVGSPCPAVAAVDQGALNDSAFGRLTVVHERVPAGMTVGAGERGIFLHRRGKCCRSSS